MPSTKTDANANQDWTLRDWLFGGAVVGVLGFVYYVFKKKSTKTKTNCDPIDEYFAENLDINVKSDKNVNDWYKSLSTENKLILYEIWLMCLDTLNMFYPKALGVCSLSLGKLHDVFHSSQIWNLLIEYEASLSPKWKSKERLDMIDVLLRSYVSVPGVFYNYGTTQMETEKSKTINLGFCGTAEFWRQCLNKIENEIDHGIVGKEYVLEMTSFLDALLRVCQYFDVSKIDHTLSEYKVRISWNEDVPKSCRHEKQDFERIISAYCTTFAATKSYKISFTTETSCIIAFYTPQLVQKACHHWGNASYVKIETI